MSTNIWYLFKKFEYIENIRKERQGIRKRDRNIVGFCSMKWKMEIYERNKYNKKSTRQPTNLKTIKM